MAGDKSNGTSGEIQIMGQPVQLSGKVHKQIRSTRSQAGFIFQQFNLVNRLSVLTNVLIGALSETPWWRSLSGQFTQAQQQNALEALERVGTVS